MFFSREALLSIRLADMPKIKGAYPINHRLYSKRWLPVNKNFKFQRKIKKIKVRRLIIYNMCAILLCKSDKTEGRKGKNYKNMTNFKKKVAIL